MVCDEYCKRKAIPSLKSISTPMAETDEHRDDDDEVGADSSVAREFVGRLLHIARGTRGDLSFAVARLARGVAQWTRKYNRWLERIMRCLSCTVKLGLVCTVNFYDMKELSLKWAEDLRPPGLVVSPPDEHGGKYTRSRACGRGRRADSPRLAPARTHLPDLHLRCSPCLGDR